MQKALAILLIVCFLSIGTLSAQSFTLSSDSVTGAEDAQRLEHVLKIKINNLSTTKAISLKWHRYENNYANGWLGTQICVYNNCYYYNVDTGTVVVQADSFESFDAHFGNNNLPGNGHMRVSIYDEDDSAGTAQSVFFGSSLTPATSVSSPMSNSSSVADIQIYPNPAKEFVIVKRPDLMSISRIEVYNMLGLKVITQYADADNTSNRIDLLDLQKGVYMLRIFDKNNNVILTKSISKIR